MNSPTLPDDFAQTPPAGLALNPPDIASASESVRRPEPDGRAAAPQPGGRSVRLARSLLLLVLVVGAGTAAGKFACEWWTNGRFLESTDDAYVGGEVTVIAPKVAGFVARMAVTDNQPVKAGDLLLKLDDRDYRAALAKAEAAVAMQKAALRNLDAERHLQEALVTQAQAGLAAAEAEATRTHDDQLRSQDLFRNGVASTQEYQKAEADSKTALANTAKASAAWLAAQRQLEVIAARKQQAQAALESAAADQAQAQLNLGYTELRAPLDGVVGNRSARVGAYATVGSQMLAIVPSRGLWIDANFKEDQLAQLRPGAAAAVQIDLLGKQIFHGRVVSVAPATGAQFSILPAENATGNFTKIVQRVAVRILLEGEAAALGQMRPGLSATVKVSTR